MIEADHPPPLRLVDDAALFLDFDGTLVELADTPSQIVVGPELGPLLRKLMERLAGRLAIVSGRSIADLENHLDCTGTPISGSHGLELRFADGTRAPLSVPRGIDEVWRRTLDWAERTPGLVVERKPAAVALHYRRVPRAEARAVQFMRQVAEDHGLRLQHGKMLVELLGPGADKGDALRTFMAQPGFAGARPLFVGDDLTDETAFAAAANMGGGGILVGPPRPTAACWRLDDVEAVAAWLRQGAGAE